MSHTPTSEQSKIIEAAVSTTAHLLVTARAGAAKTSTLCMIAEALPKVSGLVLAFNKSIKDELNTRLPQNFRAQTLNGCGFNAWRRYIGKNCKVDGDKNYRLLRARMEKLPKDDQSALFDSFADVKRAIAATKLAGALPPNLPSAFRPLMPLDDFFHDYEINLSGLEQTVIRDVVAASFAEMREGILDFDDMLLGPAVAGVSFDKYDFVMVDEAQDLSHIQHVMLKKLVRGDTRLVAVGDPCQAIYAFRGADELSMDNLGKLFTFEKFSLTITFRCGEEIVRNVHWRASDMQWRPGAHMGKVLHPERWELSDIEDGDAVICRNNAPLFSLAIALIRDGRKPELAGRDIVSELTKKMKKLARKPDRCNRDEALINLRAWHEAEKPRRKDQRKLNDEVECMRLFIKETDTLAAAILFAENIGNRAGAIRLMTGHRSKGLEFDRVFFLDPQLCKPEGQDLNIRYVIETRAKNELVYITTEGRK